MQMNVDKTKAEVQSSVIQTIRQLVRQEGISALYKGAQQNLLFFFFFLEMKELAEQWLTCWLCRRQK
jgi:hypothetical protein